MKRCTKCRKDKPTAEFFRDESKKDGLYSSCKDCVSVTTGDARLAAARRWRRRNPEKMRAYKLAELARNRKPKRIKDPTARPRARANWKRKNPAALRADRAKRRAKELQAIPAWANLKAIRDTYRRAGVLGCHVDHIVPLRSPVVCGFHAENNLQILTPTANLRKGNRLLTHVSTGVRSCT